MMSRAYSGGNQANSAARQVVCVVLYHSPLKFFVRRLQKLLAKKKGGGNLMKKKPYVKPELEMVALRVEERLAACEYYYKVGLAYINCDNKFFPLDEPGTCTLSIVATGIS
jgi:hypothetical protein